MRRRTAAVLRGFGVALALAAVAIPIAVSGQAPAGNDAGGWAHPDEPRTPPAPR